MKIILFLFLFLFFFLYANKITFEDFKTTTTLYSNQEIEQCIKKSIETHNIPKDIFLAILNVENQQKYTYAINCNSNKQENKNIFSLNEAYQQYFSCDNNVDLGLMQINAKIWNWKFLSFLKIQIIPRKVN